MTMKKRERRERRRGEAFLKGVALTAVFGVGESRLSLQ
jgi:hypothetical protein